MSSSVDVDRDLGPPVAGLSVSDEEMRSSSPKRGPGSTGSRSPSSRSGESLIVPAPAKAFNDVKPPVRLNFKPPTPDATVYWSFHYKPPEAEKVSVGRRSGVTFEGRCPPRPECPLEEGYELGLSCGYRSAAKLGCNIKWVNPGTYTLRAWTDASVDSPMEVTYRVEALLPPDA